MSDFFEYKFQAQGGGSAESRHCTYCPKQMGEACSLSCGSVYEALKAERQREGVIINDEPDKPSA